MELSLVNYQAWEKAHLNIEGLTVVVGPSNRGKSSFGRAIRGAFRNDIMPGHIKLGSSGVDVHIKFNTLDLRVSRGSKAKDGTIYQVGEEKFEKLGGDVPQAVKNQNFGPVVVDKVSIDPVFAGQFDAQFLLGSSPAELNVILNAFSSTEKLDRGRKVLGTRVNEANASAKALAPQISALEEQEAGLGETLAAAEPKLTEVLALHQRVDNLERALAALERLKAALIGHGKALGQQVALARMETALASTMRTYKAATRCTTVIVAKRVMQTSTRQVEGIQAVERALPSAMAAHRALGSLERMRSAQVSLGVLARGQAALGRVEEALKSPLRIYKALVRIKASVESDPSQVRKQAQAIQDISTEAAEKLLLAGIITKKLITLREEGQRTALALEATLADVDATGTEVDSLNTQLAEARQAGRVVTCPKCHHEFTPIH